MMVRTSFNPLVGCFRGKVRCTGRGKRCSEDGGDSCLDTGFVSNHWWSVSLKNEGQSNLGILATYNGVSFRHGLVV